MPALFAASAITAGLAIAHAVAAGFSCFAGVVQTFAWLAALQAGYLLGLWLTHGWARFDVTGQNPRIYADREAGEPGRRGGIR
jgi:hypothetical protein